MRFQMPDGDVGRAVAAVIVCHARLASTPFDQLALTLAFDVGRAALRAFRGPDGVTESRHAAL